MARFRNVLIAAAVIFSLAGCNRGIKPQVSADKFREYAGDLINRGLYKQAIEQYENYIRDYSPDATETANINYQIANLYFDRVKNYEEAMTYYLRIKHFYPQSPVITEVNKKIIACLERLDRSADAQQALGETVALDPSQIVKKRPGATVARIGSRDITLGDLDFEIDQLPPSVRDQFRSRDKKLEFLREFVATELLYDTANRAGLDKDSQVIEGAFQSKKMLMVRRLLQDKVADRININDGDVELFYQAHKSDYAEKDEKGEVKREKPLAEVRQQVSQDLYRQKYQQAYSELIQRMIMAEDVRFFDDVVK